jgi:endo-1,4-beta-xylanase
MQLPQLEKILLNRLYSGWKLFKVRETVVPKNQQYGITFWGFNDRDTWIKPFFDMEDWPCIFDNKLNKKPAFNGFYEGLVE